MKDRSKYRLLTQRTEQPFEVLMGNKAFASPRLCLRWPDGEEIFLYFDEKDMLVIKAWANSYTGENG